MFVSIGTMQQGFVGDWAVVPLMKEYKKEKEKKKFQKSFLLNFNYKCFIIEFLSQAMHV